MSDTVEAGPAIAETHISTVLFAGQRAYKLLKPIRTSFLDHRTADSRIQAVQRELVLNRRMAPDVYLGVAPVIEGDEQVDSILVMRRLPASRRLTRLLQSGGLSRVPAGCRPTNRVLSCSRTAAPPGRDIRKPRRGVAELGGQHPGHPARRRQPDHGAD